MANANQRSEDDILAQAPIQVKFGGKEYEIKIRRIKKARQWREQLIKTVELVSKELEPVVTNVDQFVGGFGFIYMKFPEQIADLVFSYDPTLPREEIEEVGTEEEIARAFGKIMDVAFPFFQQLTMVNQMVKTASRLPSPSATRSPSASGG